MITKIHTKIHCPCCDEELQITQIKKTGEISVASSVLEERKEQVVKRKYRRADDLFVTWTMVNGMTMYVCFEKNYIGPVGFVWGIGCWDPPRFTVYGSYIMPVFRRLGVRTFMNKTLLEHWDTVMSPNATGLGKKFMQANGYAFDENINYWYKHKENKK